ncbi:MAG: hypothetical protein IGS54_20900 [Elainella sp. C42_A2020_010]|nr:hypothetical protein [Elainella sp. C42_A2020_010]
MVSRKRIKLDVDWFGWPTWDLDSVGDFDPAELPISQEALNRLRAWQLAFDANFNHDYPPDSGFSSEEAREEWYREGIKIWLQLQQELGSDHEVYYSFTHNGKGQLFKLDELPDELRDKWLNDSATNLNL